MPETCQLIDPSAMKAFLKFLIILSNLSLKYVFCSLNQSVILTQSVKKSQRSHLDIIFW